MIIRVKKLRLIVRWSETWGRWVVVYDDGLVAKNKTFREAVFQAVLRIVCNKCAKLLYWD